MDLMRSILFAPGIRPNMMEKARSLPADVVILDLEDSVPVAEKEQARELVRQAIPGFPLAGQQLFVRINPLYTGLGEKDLEAALQEGVDGINFPKPSSAADILEIDRLMSFLEQQRSLPVGRIKLLPWIETAKGVMRAFEIATASPRVVGVAFGAEDFTLDMGIERTKDGAELIYARSAIAVAAQAAEVLAIDTPYPDFRDEEGLIQEAKRARALGFRGKFAIHPSQIEALNQVFSPSEEEMAYARKVVAAFEEAEAKGWSATSLEGKMIDVPIVNRARKLLALAEAMAKG